ncbi:hypothetical protein BGZ94_000995 [Podila epigama]|nr:hypothetical protein BGZ94_000995 [Podila epigama]
MRGFNPYVAAPIPIDMVEQLDDDTGDDFQDDLEDSGDLEGNHDHDGSTHGSSESNEMRHHHLFVDSRLFSTGSRHGRHTTTESLKEKFERFWTALLLAKPSSPSTGSTTTTTTTTTVKAESSKDMTDKTTVPKVLYLKDIADIIHTSFGAVVIPSLTNAVLTLRKAGHNVMIVAGHSPSLLTVRNPESADYAAGAGGGGLYGDESTTAATTAASPDEPLVTVIQKLITPTEHGHSNNLYNLFKHQQQDDHSLASLVYDNFPGPTKTFHHISVPPYLPIPSSGHHTHASATEKAQTLSWAEYAAQNEQLMLRDRADRIREINCRNMATVLRFRGGTLAVDATSEDVFGGLRSIDTEVWGFGKVYRVISNALGSLFLSHHHQQQQQQFMEETRSTGENPRTELTREMVQQTMATLTETSNLRQMLSERDWSGKVKTRSATPLIRPEDCTRHERKLLQTIVVDPAKIKTTFKTTITPPETIHALQTMITLPLIRPQLFSSGLLKNEFLSGLLLFGPPGTGKTLLAKAVARESGARMLEIKASDIFDIYVGEGEKNVAAVFSLARKLSPCVIFLDEVDSIFRARGSGGGGGGGGSGGGNSSQREILNQFMVEWDGLRSSGQNQGIVVMASTNRPFELDDAVLRRLPRRILVDLPSEKARQRILEVYLAQETLDTTEENAVDVAELVKKTAFFSGSDLKNLCVAAALASVRETVENEVRLLQPDAHENTFGEQSQAQSQSQSQSEKKDQVLDLSPLLDRFRKEAIQAHPSSSSSSRATSSSSTSTLAGPSAPPVRVISKRHFEKAMQQITPSCSENMESLTEIRKWDGLYGDGGKGRKKTVKGIGF